MSSRPEIQVKALAEGLPYQTLIASILHKYVTGRLEERKPGSPPAVPKATAATRRSAHTDT
jgi:hypothetical protein